MSNYISAMSTKSNAQVGSSAFNEEAKKLDGSQVNGETRTASLAASGKSSKASGSLAASFGTTTTEGQYDGKNEFTSSKKMRKAAQMSQTGKKTTKRREKMVAEMSINVVRYEMFLREVAPNNIKAGFLDCFMNLPQSFYAPGNLLTHQN